MNRLKKDKLLSQSAGFAWRNLKTDSSWVLKIGKKVQESSFIFKRAHLDEKKGKK